MLNIIISFFKRFTEISHNTKHHISGVKNDSAVLSNTIDDYEKTLTSFGVRISETCHNKIVNTINEHTELLHNVAVSSSPEEDEKNNPMEEILANTVKYNMLDEKAVVDFEKKVFSLQYFRKSTPVPYNIDLTYILNKFIENNEYKEIIIQNERLHSLEFARLMGNYLSGNQEEKDSFDSAISDSFNELATIYCDKNKYVKLAWMRYLCFSASLNCNIPNALLDYITKKNYKILFSHLQQKCNKQVKDEKDDINEYAIAVCKKILDDIKPNDIPAMLMLGKIAEECRMLETARFYYSQAANEYNSFNAAMSLINSYENEIKALLEQKNSTFAKESSDLYDVKIKNANTELSVLYETWENKLLGKYQSQEHDDRTSDELTSILTKHARYEKNRKNYDKASNILRKAFDLLPESYRMYSELGLLYQTPGTQYKSNKYYNPTKAVEMFLKALEILKSETNEKDSKKVEKSILVPLANTYYMTKQYDEATKVCKSVLNIDGHEKNALKLIQTIHNEKNVA